MNDNNKLSSNNEIKNKFSVFPKPTNDIIYKSMWINGNTDVRKFLERMVEYAIERNLGDYELGPNETGKDNKESIANKVDVLLFNNNKGSRYRINVEMNASKSSSCVDYINNKSRIYLTKITGNFYSGLEIKEHYKEPIVVEQVNFNAFYNPENKDLYRSDFRFEDKRGNLTEDRIEYHNIYLPRMKELCYDKDNKEDIYKDFALLLCDNFEEAEKLAKGNKEREAVVKFLRNFNMKECDFMINPEMPKLEYHKELELLEAEAKGKEQGLSLGIEQGIEQGLSQGIEQTTKKMIIIMNKNGLTPNDISKAISMDLNKVKSILQDA